MGLSKVILQKPTLSINTAVKKAEGKSWLSINAKGSNLRLLRLLF